MGDLVGKKRSEPVRLVGADPVSGDEDNFGGVTSDNKAMVVDRINGSAVYGEITVGTVPVEVKVGALPLANRKMVHVTPKDSGVHFGYDNLVTTTTGSKLFKNTTAHFSFGPNVSIWLVASTSGKKVNIGEGA